MSKRLIIINFNIKSQKNFKNFYIISNSYNNDLYRLNTRLY